jgi:cell division protease FtsH
MHRQRDFSENTAKEIDNELKSIITGCFDRARTLLLDNIDSLHAVATALLEKEVLDGQEIDELLSEKVNGLVVETVRG